MIRRAARWLTCVPFAARALELKTLRVVFVRQNTRLPAGRRAGTQPSLGRLASLVGLSVTWGIHMAYATRLLRCDATRLPRREPIVQLRTDPELRIRPQFKLPDWLLLASWSFGGLFSSFPTITPPSNGRTERQRFRRAQKNANGQERCGTRDRIPKSCGDVARLPPSCPAKGARPPHEPFSLCTQCEQYGYEDTQTEA